MKKIILFISLIFKIFIFTQNIQAQNTKSIKMVNTISELKSYSGDELIYLNESGKSGLFSFTKENHNYKTDNIVVFETIGGYRIRQFDGLVNVKWFGAMGDNQNDDTKALQDAINYSSEYKKKIFIPAGTYKFSKLYLKHNAGIEGEGIGSSILLSSEPKAGSAIIREDDDSFIAYCSFRSLTIATSVRDLSESEEINKKLIGLNLTGCAYTHIENCRIAGFGMGGIVFSRAEKGNEGFDFNNTTKDGNYNTLNNIILSYCGNFNDDNAAIWFKYKANSNKLYGIYFKGGINNCIVFDLSNDNLISGASFESCKRGVWFKSLSKNSTVTQVRAEVVREAIFKADSGAKGHLILNYHQSTSTTVFDFNKNAFIRVLGGHENNLRSGELQSRNLNTTSDYDFVDLLGLLTPSDGTPLYIKSKEYNAKSGSVNIQLRNTKTDTGNGYVLSEIQAYSGNQKGSGINAKIQAVNTDNTGKTAWKFFTGKNDSTSSKLLINDNVQIPGNANYTDAHFMLGNSHLWIGNEGEIRFKNSSPLNNLDGFSLPRNGVAKISADGTEKSFKILHGYNKVPLFYTATANSKEAGNILFVSANEKYIIIHYSNAPPEGNENIIVSWSAGL